MVSKGKTAFFFFSASFIDSFIQFFVYLVISLFYPRFLLFFFFEIFDAVTDSRKRKIEKNIRWSTLSLGIGILIVVSFPFLFFLPSFPSAIIFVILFASRGGQTFASIYLFIYFLCTVDEIKKRKWNVRIRFTEGNGSCRDELLF